MAAPTPERREIKFSPKALAYLRRLVDEAPPLTPEAQAVIRACCTKPRTEKTRKTA